MVRRKSNKNQGGKKSSPRNRGTAHATFPVVLYAQLPPTAAGSVGLKNFSIAELLAGFPSDYVYKLMHLTVSVMAPSFIRGTTALFPVDSLLMQVYGFMVQDSTLQRAPMTTWRQISTTTPHKFTFARGYIRSHVYTGGHVPITNINTDDVFGCHFVWTSASVVTPTEVLTLTVNIRATFEMEQDLRITLVTASGDRFRLNDQKDDQKPEDDDTSSDPSLVLVN